MRYTQIFSMLIASLTSYSSYGQITTEEVKIELNEGKTLIEDNVDVVGKLNLKAHGTDLPLKINSIANIIPPNSTGIFLHQSQGGNYNTLNSKIVFSPDGTSYPGSLGVIGITRDTEVAPHISRLRLGSDHHSDILSIDLYHQRMGIGGVYRPAYTLHVNGSAYSSGGWSGSDVRFKKNIAPIENGLTTLLALRGVSFDWRNGEFSDRTFPEKREIGFIAQEVEEHLPEVVNTDFEGYKAISYEKVTALLVEAIKELNGKVEALEKELADLKE